nr:PREDICTED: CD5 antigen-like [Anolis carolinensis]|eukprot:XP_016854450.1 PREDICTED: CD5 antigen-like [Anolis carolinensis]
MILLVSSYFQKLFTDQDLVEINLQLTFFSENIISIQKSSVSVKNSIRAQRILSGFSLSGISGTKQTWFLIIFGMVVNILSLPTSTKKPDNDCCFVSFSVMRLADGRHRCTGRVELFLDGQWRMVSYRRWDLKEPWVVCRHLGCEAAPHPLMYPIYGEKTPSIWMDGVQCTGTETSFSECEITPWQDSDLDRLLPFYVVGVTCTELRLVNGSNYCSGRIEVFHNEMWGTICDAGWDLQDAQVVCRELGCGEALSASGGAQFGRGAGPIWLEGMSCTGTEESLRQCPKGQWGEHSCDHSRDASVECAELRLVNGPNICSGHLEVLYNQQWGTVCDIGWDTHDAQVVCRELNCGDASKGFEGVRYGQGSGLIWLENVNCTGEEMSLTDCPKSP